MKAQTPSYTYFQLTVDPRYVSSEIVFMTIEAKNISGQTFQNGDVTISFKEDITAALEGKVICEVMRHNATAIRQFPPGSKIFSVERGEGLLSEDLIVQALKDNWRSQQVIQLTLKLTIPVLPLKVLVRVAARLEGGEALFFEPTSGAKDQQGLYAERFLIERDPMRFDFDGDGTEEIFVQWKKGEYGNIHHYQVYKKIEGEYARLSEFELEGMPNGSMGVRREPDPNQPGKVIFVVQGGAMWAEYYSLSRDGKSANMITSGVREKQFDLDHDGIYEWLFSGKWGRMTIFQWEHLSFSYQSVWPPADRAFAALDERLYDLDDDDNREIVGVIHPREGDAKSRKLSIYKLSHGVVTLISQIDVTHPYPAYQILGIRQLRDRKQIVLGLAKGQKFGGDVFLSRPGYRVPVPEEEIVAGYDFKDGRLEFSWLNSKIAIATSLPRGLDSQIETTIGEDQTLDIADVDGQEAMRFVDKETGQSIILKGEKEFSPAEPVLR